MSGSKIKLPKHLNSNHTPQKWIRNMNLRFTYHVPFIASKHSKQRLAKRSVSK